MPNVLDSRSKFSLVKIRPLSPVIVRRSPWLVSIRLVENELKQTFLLLLKSHHQHTKFTKVGNTLITFPELNGSYLSIFELISTNKEKGTIRFTICRDGCLATPPPQKKRNTHTKQKKNRPNYERTTGAMLRENLNLRFQVG